MSVFRLRSRYLAARLWFQLNFLSARRINDFSMQIAVADLPEFLRRERVEADVMHLDLPPDGISLEGSYN